MVSLPTCPKTGVVGVAVYWFEWSLIAIPCAFAFYCMFLATQLAKGYWMKVVGAGPLACTAISIIFALCYAVLHVLQQFSLIPAAKQLLKIVSAAATAVALITFAVLLTFFTPTEFERNRIDFHEYTLRNRATNAEAESYYQLNLTGAGQHQILTIIADRSITPKLPLVAFFITWVTAFSCYFLGSSLTGHGSQNEHRDGQTLLPSHASDEEGSRQSVHIKADPEPESQHEEPPKPQEDPHGDYDYDYSDYMSPA